MKKYLSGKIATIIILTLFLAFFALPENTQKAIFPLTPEFITNNKINLGLDLQGGSQLDYKINLANVPEADKESIINGVQSVIEKRVNGLGVAEPNIYISEIADEKHIMVELAENGIITQEDITNYISADKTIEELTDDEKKFVSLEKAKATVGKTIQLEFKEEKTSLDPQEKEKVKEQAKETLAKINDGANFSVIGQEEALAYPGKISHETIEYSFENDIDAKIRETIKSLEIGYSSKELIETGGSFSINEGGQAVEQTGLAIVKLLDSKEEIKNAKEVSVSHILIAYKGAEGADETVTRTEDEAYELAKEIKTKLEAGGDFTALAKESSNDNTNKETGGKLDTAVSGEGTYVYDFEQAALAFEKEGELSDTIKTQFGYHIIKADKIAKDVKEKQYRYEVIEYSTVADPWQDTGLTGKHFVHADVQMDNFYQAYVSIQFNDEGAKLFEEITDRNVNKQVAIFVGGELISAPRVNEKISGGSAQITGQFTSDEAKTLARDLNTGAIPAPIILTGEYTIGATLGHEALNKSLYAGIIGVIIVMIFMIAYYRIPGLVASIALTSYATILLFLIKSHLHLGIALLISLVIFLFLILKIVNNKDSGWEKFLSFILSCAGFFFLTYMLKTSVVLTLAGIAGIILSIGMAVDANILIFERVKEELRAGKPLKTAIDTGFIRAWSAIRDSNFSTLLTCGILFYFGSSIIKGFAFNLAAGILVSMFTAITITRTLLLGFVGGKLAKNVKLFGGEQKKKERKFGFIKYSKVWLGISGTLVVISIVSMFAFGLNLGIDFKGGTLLEFKFSETINKDDLRSTLNEIGKELEAKSLETTANVEKTSMDEITISTTEDSSSIDLEHIQILDSGENGFIVKTKYMSSEAHTEIINLMKEKLPNFTEPRFTTIGPTIGATLLKKALTAIIFTLIMIIIYIGIAFRKVTKELNSWKFGATAIVALAHDVIITTGLFVILSQFFNVEIDALFITAMLTVFGYSVNDTIVVFDRLRENLIDSKGESLVTLTDKSLNQTLARSLNTSLSTIITLIAVLVLGSNSIFFFVLALTAGITIGTYSSIFTASPLLVMWEKWQNKK